MDDNPEIRDRLNVNKSTYHNKRPRERFICFIRGAKWMKINHLNGPSPIHDTSTWLSQSIQSIRHVCCRLGMQKNLPWKCFRTAFGHYDFPSTVLPSKLDACANVTTCCCRMHTITWSCRDTLISRILRYKTNREIKVTRTMGVVNSNMMFIIKKERVY